MILHLFQYSLICFQIFFTYIYLCLSNVVAYLESDFVSMQDSSRTLAGEKGYGHLKNLQKSLRMRQQYMVSQVTLLYPVKIVVRKASEQELESFRSSIKSGKCDKK